MKGGETNNKDNDIIEETFNRIGANIMGKKMFAPIRLNENPGSAQVEQYFI